MNMATVKAGNANIAVSAGLGLGLGLILAKYVLHATTPQERNARQLIVCLRCAGKNQLENKYCWHCGHPLYPAPSTQCSMCRATVPSMRYCGNCGTKLRK